MHLDFTTFLPIAVPGGLTLLLIYVMQKVKPLLERLPGMHMNDSMHDENLRLCYGVAAFVLVLGYALLTGSIPTSAQTWVTLLGSTALTAIGMTSAGHLVYRNIRANSSGSAVDVPPDGASAFFSSSAPATPQQQ